MRRSAGAALVLALLVAGCASGDPAPTDPSDPTAAGSSTASASSTASGTGTPTPSATPTDTTSSASPTASATPSSPSATSSSSATAGKPAGSGRTTITLRFADPSVCRDGRVGFYNTTTSPIQQKVVRVRSGAATLQVRSGTTRRMSFDVDCAGWPTAGAVPVVVLQYRGVTPGSPAPVGAAGQPRGEAGSWCWAGTQDQAVTLTLRTYLDEGDGTPLGGIAAVWADPTVATVATTDGQRWQRTFQGSLGHQDLPYC